MSASKGKQIPIRRKDPKTGKSEFAGSISTEGKKSPAPLSPSVKDILGPAGQQEIRSEDVDKAYALLSRKIVRSPISDEAFDESQGDFRIPRIIEVETPTCPVCSKAGTMQVDAWAYRSLQLGSLIQDAFPDMLPAEREQLKTGIHSECWEKVISQGE